MAGVLELIWADVEAEYFCEALWTENQAIRPTRKSPHGGESIFLLCPDAEQRAPRNDGRYSDASNILLHQDAYSQIALDWRRSLDVRYHSDSEKIMHLGETTRCAKSDFGRLV